MKNLLLASAGFCVALALSNAANAYDSTGCGLGSMAWRGQSGILPQVLAFRQPNIRHHFRYIRLRSERTHFGRHTKNDLFIFGKQYGTVRH